MCATPIGALGHLGLQKEASFKAGTVGASGSQSFQPITSEGLVITHGNVYSDRVQDTGEQLGTERGNYGVAGPVTFPISPQNDGRWFECALGGGYSPYSIERPLGSLVLEIDREQLCVNASGCMIGSITFGSSQGGELIATADIEAAGMTSGDATSATYTADDNPYLHSDAVFTINGVDISEITTWSLTLNNNLVTDLWGTGREREDIPATKLAVTGSFSKLFKNTAERNTFMSNDESSFKVVFTRGTKSLVFLCAKTRYDSAPANIGGQAEYILDTFNFTAFVDDPATQYSVRISGDIT